MSKLTQPIDIYLYDGSHDYDSHKNAITRIWSVLANQAIVIVDDWNNEIVRNGMYSCIHVFTCLLT